MFWQCGRYTLPLVPHQPLIMGILNITPDSFFDGGKHTELTQILKHAAYLIETGADIIDLGAESSRPGATPVSETDEIERLKPILAKLIPLAEAANVPVSIDTYKPTVMQMTLEMGVSILNDITGFIHPEAQAIANRSQAGLVIMHMKGQPHNMQENPIYENVNREVWDFLVHQQKVLHAQGISLERIMLDPGIGFGKKADGHVDHNIQLLQQLPQYSQQHRTLIGLSRKYFLGGLAVPEGAERLPAKDRLPATIVANLYATQQGAHVLRVHDVKETKEALNVMRKLSTPI
jgi:dihydropteroate synthase